MKKKMIMIMMILVVLSVGITVILLKQSNKKYITNNITPPVQELLGQSRVDAQKEIINVIEKYINDKTEIKKYLDEKNSKKISIKELKEELNIDTSEFENLEYDCDSDFTTIDFNDDYSEHVISLTCSSIFKKND